MSENFDRKISWNRATSTAVPDAFEALRTPPDDRLDHGQFGFSCSFSADSLIATKQGPTPVSELSVGTRILTRDHGFQPLLRVVRHPSSPKNQAVKTIFIRQGALGRELPTVDMHVPANQLFLVLDLCPKTGLREYLVRAEDLLHDRAGMRYKASKNSQYSVFLDKHKIILANGLWVSSSFECRLNSDALSAAQRKLLALNDPEPINITRPIMESNQVHKLFGRANRSRGLYDLNL